MAGIQSVSAGNSAGNKVTSPVVEQAPKVDAAKSTSPNRAIHDRVDLSGAGQKMVNLDRGQELAAEIRSKTVDENFSSELRKAIEDIRRITRLFTETIKAGFIRRS